MGKLTGLLSARIKRDSADARGGFVLPMVIMFAILIMLLGWAALTLAGHEGELTIRDRVARQSLYTAEAGVQRALARLAVSDTWEEHAGVLYDDEPFADGSYTVTITYGQPGPNEITITSDGTYRNRTRRIVMEVTRGF